MFTYTFSIEFQSDEKEFKVWIWDAIHIEDNNFLLISIHNTSVIWNSVTGDTFPIASCSEQCILYPFPFFYNITRCNITSFYSG